MKSMRAHQGKWRHEINPRGGATSVVKWRRNISKKRRGEKGVIEKQRNIIKN